MKTENEVIFCIVNAGFGDTVMDVARAAGAGGGTILRARGTASPAAEKFFQISVQPEKEIVMIVADVAIRDAVLHAVYSKVGLDTPGQGIAFSLPVDAVVGVKIKKNKPEEKKE